MIHPLDHFLKTSLSKEVENDVPTFQEFLDHSSKQSSNALDHWLKEQADHTSSEKFEFSDFLKYQEQKEVKNHPIDEWIKSKNSNLDFKEKTSFQEFNRYWTNKIIQKWFKRAAIFLLLFISIWLTQTDHFLQIFQSKQGWITTQQKNQNIQNNQKKEGELSSKSMQKDVLFLPKNKSTGSQKFKFSNARISSKKINRRSQKSKSNISFKNKILRNDDFLSSNETSKGRLFHSGESKNSLSFPKNQEIECIELLELKSKSRNISSLFERNSDLPLHKSSSKKRSYLQFNLWSGATNQKLAFLGEKNKHWDRLQDWTLSLQKNVNVAFHQPLNHGYGWGLGLNFAQSILSKELEFHITEIPVLDSASGKILGYIPLGPRGQVHVEENIKISQSRLNIQGSIQKSWKISPTYEVGIQQYVGMGIKKISFQKIIDPISLMAVQVQPSHQIELVGNTQVWVQNRIANHWGIGAQMGRPFSLNFSNKNALIFKEMSIFEAGVSVRYYLSNR